MWDAQDPSLPMSALPAPVQDHLTGKQYLGWMAIREKHKELQDSAAAAPATNGESHRHASARHSAPPGHGLHA